MHNSTNSSCASSSHGGCLTDVPARLMACVSCGMGADGTASAGGTAAAGAPTPGSRSCGERPSLPVPTGHASVPWVHGLEPRRAACSAQSSGVLLWRGAPVVVARGNRRLLTRSDAPSRHRPRDGSDGDRAGDRAGRDPSPWPAADPSTAPVRVAFVHSAPPVKRLGRTPGSHDPRLCGRIGTRGRTAIEPRRAWRHGRRTPWHPNLPPPTPDAPRAPAWTRCCFPIRSYRTSLYSCPMRATHQGGDAQDFTAHAGGKRRCRSGDTP